jgi:hypothetical protein
VIRMDDAAVGGYVWVPLKLSDEPYSLLFNSSNGNTEVPVTLPPAKMNRLQWMLAPQPPCRHIE